MRFCIQINTGPVWQDAEDAEQAVENFRASDHPAARWPILSVNPEGPEHLHGTAKRIPQAVRDCLSDITRKANRERCGVETSDDMRLYLDSWVTGPLRDVLAWADGETSTTMLKYNIKGH